MEINQPSKHTKQDIAWNGPNFGIRRVFHTPAIMFAASPGSENDTFALIKYSIPNLKTVAKRHCINAITKATPHLNNGVKKKRSFRDMFVNYCFTQS